MRGKKDTLEIFILITNACNLHCSYCYESSKNTGKLLLVNMQKELKLFITSQQAHYSSIQIIFHGGEPFLNFDLMRRMSEWVWQFYPDIQCCVTTNGTILTAPIKQWLTNNKQHFTAILSLDGDRVSHNLNRDNSYDKIDRHFFLTTYPLQAVKMTVASNTLSHMFDNFIALRQEGFLVNIGLANEIEWNEKEALSEYAHQMKLLADYYITHPEEYPCQMMAQPIMQLSPDIRLIKSKGCGAGTNIIAFDVEGNRYPCHSFIADFKRPYIPDEIEVLFDQLKKSNGKEISPECYNCPVYGCCSPCYGLNYINRGNMGKCDPIMCLFYKINIKATAYMYAHILQEPQNYVLVRGKNQQEISHLAKAIKFIFNRI